MFRSGCPVVRRYSGTVHNLKECLAGSRISKTLAFGIISHVISERKINLSDISRMCGTHSYKTAAEKCIFIGYDSGLRAKVKAVTPWICRIINIHQRKIRLIACIQSIGNCRRICIGTASRNLKATQNERHRK